MSSLAPSRGFRSVLDILPMNLRLIAHAPKDPVLFIKERKGGIKFLNAATEKRRQS